MKAPVNPGLYRKLPSVDELLRVPELAPSIAQAGQEAVAEAIRAVLLRLRDEISAGQLDESGVELALSGITAAVERQLRQALSYSLRSVINATGVILHTNIGRAPVAAAALDHIREIGGAYSNLEFDTADGERGQRDIHVDRLFRKLLSDRVGPGIRRIPTQTIPAQSGTTQTRVSTIVVNNNAAAVLLALNTLGEGGEVIVSRGELIEIGESFRIPDILAKSNALLREVGTTNRTRVSDYERAITENTRVLLRVHRSNFQITGFTEQPRLEELAALARKHHLPLVEDLGSGSLFDLASVGVSGEPSVLDSLRAGVDVVTYSGDKLLGGPQAGMLSGRNDLIGRMRANALFRALRVDKLTYAALEATLLVYVKQDHDSIPAVRMMRLTKEDIGRRAEALARKIRASPFGRSAGVPPATVSSRRLSVEIVDGESVIGGGAAPSAVLPTRLLALSCDGLSADELAKNLRLSDPPVIARVEEGRVLIDLRTVFPQQDEIVAQICARL